MNHHETLLAVWSFNAASFLAAQVYPVIGTLGALAGLAYTVYQFQRDVRKDRQEPKN
jgi:uncharacterized membrane protein YebE (DUF533 family)